jgi:alkylhydroperoxidase/carboxymuconolactone decarboxylase family protein YurZ
MTAVDLPIEELRQRIAQLSSQGQGASGPGTAYRDLFGFVPPCAVAQGSVPLASTLRDLHEQVRLRELLPSALSAKDAHLILLAMLLKEHGANAVVQGVAARRAGASWEELRGVVRLAFLLHGLAGANRGDEFMTALAEHEREDRIAGAVAAYG